MCCTVQEVGVKCYNCHFF